MAQIDLVIIILLVWGGYRGWKNGLLKEFASLVGIVLGLFIAYELYGLFGDFLAPHISSNVNIGKFVGRLLAFIILWIVVPIFMGLFATFVTKTIMGPRLGFINSFTGLLIGSGKFLILLNIIFAALSAVGFMNQEKKNKSLLYKPIASLGESLFQRKTWNVNSKGEQKTKKDSTIWVPIHHQGKK